MAGKRSPGEGNVRRRANGTWCGEVMNGYKPDGKRNIVRFSGRTKSDVLEKIRRYWNEQGAGLSVQRNLTLPDWADIWYADLRSQVQPSN